MTRARSVLGILVLAVLVNVAFLSVVTNVRAATTLTNGVTANGSLSAAGGSASYVIAVPAGQSLISAELHGPSGTDYDLYMRYNAAPTTSTYDARGYTSSSDETCSVSSPSAGDYYVMVRSYRGTGAFTIKATYTGGGSPNTTGITYTTLTLGTAASGAVTTSVGSLYYKLVLSAANPKLTFTLTGPASGADFDLYVKKGADPSSSVYDWKSDSSLASESIVVANATSGTYNVLVKAYSGTGSFSILASGNTAPPTDTTAPVISSIAADKTTNTITITWTTDEAATSLVKYGVSTTDQQATVSGLATSHSIQITGLTAATTYKYQIFSSDAAGNQASSTVRQVTTLNGTTTGPIQLTLDVSKTGSLAAANTQADFYVVVSSGATLTVTMTGPASGADFDLYVKLGAQPTTTVYDAKSTTSSTTETVSITNPAGTYYIMVYAYSGSGSFSVKASVATTPADTTAPQVAFTAPSNGATVSGTLTISLSATDANGIASYQILVDGTSKATAQTYSWNTASFSDGSHTIVGKATDPSGNVGTATITVTVQNGVTPPPTTGAKWTWAIFVGADNSLSSCADTNFAQLKQGLTTASVGVINVIAVIDQSRSGDVKCYKITPGGSTAIANSAIDSSWGTEIDTGSYVNMEKFAKYVYTNYPAQHYLLDLWNHGGAWSGCNWDDTSGSHCTMAQLKTMVAYVQASVLNGNKIDVLGFDECLMDTPEALAQISPSVSYAFASEKSEPGDGWCYDTMLKDLCANTGWTGSQLADDIAKKYVAQYTSDDVTGAAIDLSKIPDLLTAIDALAQAIIAAGSSISSSMSSAVSATQQYDSYSQYDLYDLCAKIISKVSVAAVKTAATNLETLITSSGLVIGSYHYGSGATQAHGMAIYWGTDYSNSEYTNTNFCSQTKWDDMLRTFA
jgi:hypothetical protein